MAYTSIWPVHRLDNSINYVKDKEKTVKKSETADTLADAIDYALNREKTEQTIFEDALGCTCENAFEDMLATKRRFHKMSGVQGYHLIQSFAAGEVTPELAHAIGQELAEQLLKGQFEVVIATHLNTSHYHNHLVFNSVSMEDGHKYHSNARSYYREIQRVSDALCKKYGLSVIQANDGKGRHYAQWQVERDGRPSWRTSIRLDIRETINDSFTWRQFIAGMERRGYQWKLDQKYVALRAPGMERFVRLKSLGKGYSEEELRERILQPMTARHRRSGKASMGIGRPGMLDGYKKLTGLQALYYSYLYQMGGLVNKPPRTSYIVRTDIRHLDRRIAQMEFLQKHGITTREQLAEYRRPLEEQVTALTKERHRLYRAAPESERIGEITKMLKPIRKEIRICVQIERHSLEMEQRFLDAERLEKLNDIKVQEKERQKKQSRDDLEQERR